MGNTFKLGNYVNAIFQDTSNNVGIGAAPSGSYKLDVSGTGRFTSTLLVSGAATFSSSVFSLRSNIGTGTSDDADISLNVSAPSGAGKYIMFGRNSSNSAVFSLSSAGAITSAVSIQNASTYIISSSVGTAISSMSSGIVTIRDQSNGGGCLVFYENAQTPIIITQAGATVYTTSSPSASQIQLTSSGGGGGITALGGSSRNSAQIVVATFKNS